MPCYHLMLVLEESLVACGAEPLGLVFSVSVLAFRGKLRNAFVDAALLAHAVKEHVSRCVWAWLTWIFGRI